MNVMNRTKWGAGCWLLCLQYFAAEAIAIAGWRGGGFVNGLVHGIPFHGGGDMT